MSIDGGAPPASAASRGERIATVLVIPLVIILAVLIGVLYVVFRPVRVDGPSMEPGLQSEDRVLVLPGYAAPRRGDIVVVRDEPSKGENVVKRVVGIPGDTVRVRDDVAYVNGAEEEYRFRVTLVAGTRPYALEAVAVPAGALFLMGDNRPVSLDSRDIGPVPIGRVMGKVVAVVLPPQRAHAIDYGRD